MSDTLDQLLDKLEQRVTKVVDHFKRLRPTCKAPEQVYMGNGHFDVIACGAPAVPGTGSIPYCEYHEPGRETTGRELPDLKDIPLYGDKE